MKKITAPELWAAGLMGLAALFLMIGYELLRSSTTSLFNQAFGVDNQAYALILTPLMLMAMIWIYGRWLSLMGPKRTLIFTTLVSALVFCFSYYLFEHGNKWSAGFLYIYREAYVVVIVEQYWSFINSRLSVHSSKRLSGPIIGISTIGAVTGGLLLKSYAQSWGSASMFLVAATFMLPSALMAGWAYLKAGEPHHQHHEKRADVARDSMGLTLFKSHPVLLALLTIVILSQVVSAGLYFRFQGELQSAFPNPDDQTAFSGSVYAWTNGTALIFQFIITPLALRFLKTSWIQLAMPAVHLATCSLAFFHPTLFNVTGAYLIFKAFDYSLFKAAKEVFYIPFSFDVRFRAKQIIDSFGYRFGKGLSSIGVVIIKATTAVTQPIYSLVAIAGSIVWLAAALPVARALMKGPSDSRKA